MMFLSLEKSKHFTPLYTLNTAWSASSRFFIWPYVYLLVLDLSAGWLPGSRFSFCPTSFTSLSWASTWVLPVVQPGWGNGYLALVDLDCIRLSVSLKSVCKFDIITTMYMCNYNNLNKSKWIIRNNNLVIMCVSCCFKCVCFWAGHLVMVFLRFLIYITLIDCYSNI